MPYAQRLSGVYRISHDASGHCYVGQSRNFLKRVSEHFRLLRKGNHPNTALQKHFDKFEGKGFRGELEILCDDPKDLDVLEEAFLQGEARFDDSPLLFNISSTAKKPMQGRKHTPATKDQISQRKKGRTDHVTPEYRQKLSAAQTRRHKSDPLFFQKVKFLVQNPHLSYAERGRRVGLDTGSARRLALKYANDEDFLNG